METAVFGTMKLVQIMAPAPRALPASICSGGTTDRRMQKPSTEAASDPREFVWAPSMNPFAFF